VTTLRGSDFIVPICYTVRLVDQQIGPTKNFCQKKRRPTATQKLSPNLAVCRPAILRTSTYPVAALKCEMFAVQLNSFAFIQARTINFIVIRRYLFHELYLGPIELEQSTELRTRGRSLKLNEKKRSEKTQTLFAGCSKTEPKISPRRRPISGGAGRPKFNQLEMVTTFTY